MSFRMFAAGTGGFNHTREHADEGDVFDLATLMGRMNASVGGVRSFAQNEVQGAVTPDSALQQGLVAMGTITCVDSLRTQFQLTQARFSTMTLAVSTRRTNTIMPDDAGHTSVTCRSSDHDAFRNFMRHVHPVLEKTELNRFAVLCAMAQVLSEWSLSGARASGRAMLHMQISSG